MIITLSMDIRLIAIFYWMHGIKKKKRLSRPLKFAKIIRMSMHFHEIETWKSCIRIDRLIDRSIDWLIDWFINWLIDYSLFYIPFKKYHLYEDVTITGEGLQNVAYAWQSGPLTKFEQGGILNLSFHTCCDTGPRFFWSHPKDLDRPIQSPLTTQGDLKDLFLYSGRIFFLNIFTWLNYTGFFS
jgi:hypothetical protein